MSPDLLRLGLVILFSGVAGMIAGNLPAGLAAGLFLYAIWQQRALQKIVNLLRSGNERGLAPPPGALAEALREFDSLRARHKQRENRLMGFLSRFEEATRALPDAIVVMDTQGHVEWTNKKADDYLGIRCPRDRGQRLSNLIRQPDLHSCLAEEGAVSASAGLVIVSPMDADVSLGVRVIRYAGSSLLLVAANVTDIQRANRMRKDFIANASHELRTPLTVISGYLETLEHDTTGPSGAWHSRIEKMRAQARRMQNLIDDLLKLSRLESSPSADDDAEVDVEELIRGIQAEAQTLSGAQGHVIETELTPGLLVKGSRDGLYSAFSNIIFNAVQYTPPGGAIHVSWRQTDQGASLEVTDSGEGIPAEHVHRVTERFYRVDKGRSREKGGTGLGLAIVKHVMAQHNAEIKISSVVGSGTTVSCLIPARRVVRGAA